MGEFELGFIRLLCTVCVIRIGRGVGLPCPGDMMDSNKTRCVCTTSAVSSQVETLRCSSVESAQVPVIYPHQGILREFILEDSRLDEIQDYAFANLQASHVTLRSCEIRKINTHAFAGVGNVLMQLNVVNNSIEFVAERSFSDLPLLEGLSLESNHLHELNPAMFARTPKLSALTLANNVIATLPDNLFQALDSLQRLDLHNNEIENITRDTFRGLRNLRVLDLRNNSIASIDVSAFNDLELLDDLALSHNRLSSIPERLFQSTEYLRTLRIDNNDMEEIPENLLLITTYVEHLDFSYNAISSLDSYPFPIGITRLKTLYLNNNQIGTLLQDTFEHLSSLKDLHLEGNGIANLEYNCLTGLYFLENLHLQHNSFSHVPLGVFDSAGKLKFLDLSHNNISILDKEPFQPLKLLTHLNLSHNQLVEVKEDWFTKTFSLYELNINHNMIWSIARHSFDQMSKLIKLDLSHNKIYNPPPDLLRNCTKLTVLNLANNPLGHLAPGFLQACRTLKTLDLSKTCQTRIPKESIFYYDSLEEVILSNNAISLVDSKSLEGSRSVRHLDLSYNAITAIPSRTFEYLLNAEYIDLSHNRITSTDFEDNSRFLRRVRYLDLSYNSFDRISRRSLLNLTDLVDLSLTGNPIRCDCDATWLRSSYWLKDYTSITCSEPESVANVRVVCFNQTGVEGGRCPIWPSVDHVTAFCRHEPVAPSSGENTTWDMESSLMVNRAMCHVQATSVGPVRPTRTPGINTTEAPISSGAEITELIPGVHDIHIVWSHDGINVLYYKVILTSGDDLVNVTFSNATLRELTIDKLKSDSGYLVCIDIISVANQIFPYEEGCKTFSTKPKNSMPDVVNEGNVTPDPKEVDLIATYLPIIIAAGVVLFIIIITIISVYCALTRGRNKKKKKEEERKAYELALEKKAELWRNSENYKVDINEELAEQSVLVVDDQVYTALDDARFTDANGRTGESGSVKNVENGLSDHPMMVT